MSFDPFSARRARLREELSRRDLAGALITDPNHFFYLTGLLPNANFISLFVLGRDRGIAITPQLGVDTTRLASTADSVEIITYANLAMADLNRDIDENDERDKAIKEAMRRLGLAGQPIGVDAHHFWHDLGILLGVTDEKVVDIGRFLIAQRKIKDSWEQEQITFAVHLNDVGFAATQAFLRPGVTDLEAYSHAWLAMANELGRPFELRGEFSGGPDISGKGGSAPLKRVMNARDILIADIYPVINGYYADTTRNFVIGKPTPWQSELHLILEEAMAKGEEAIQPGLPAAELDRIVRGYLVAHAPHGATTFHHMGHGVGIGAGRATHSAPFIVPHSHDVLMEGMVFTLEPGLYIAGRGGMRLEDNYVVTANGCRPLGQFPKKLAVCG